VPALQLKNYFNGKDITGTVFLSATTAINKKTNILNI